MRINSLGCTLAKIWRMAIPSYLLHNCVKNAFHWNVITKEIQIRASYWAGQILEKGKTIAQQQLHSYLQGLPHLNQKPVSVDRTVDFLWNQNHCFPLSPSSAPTICTQQKYFAVPCHSFFKLKLKKLYLSTDMIITEIKISMQRSSS